MNKPNILSTPFARAYNLEALAKDAAKFLQKHIQVMDLSQEGYIDLLSEVRPMTASPMAEFYRAIVTTNKLSNLLYFSLVNDKHADIPELLTMDDIVVDGKYLETSLPNELKKAWVNLTPVLTAMKRARSGQIFVDDIPKLMSSVVRAYLCTSYNDSAEWLPPKISTFVIEFYTLALSMVIDRLYNLNWEESLLPKLLFAWYYASLLGPAKDDPNMPLLLSRNSKLFKGVQTGEGLENTFAEINRIRGQRPMSLEVVAEVLREIGTRRMEHLQSVDIRRVFALSTQDNTALMIAIDYPPYLVHQILRVADGGKHPILSTIFKNRFSASVVNNVLDQLVLNKQLVEGVNRG
jgi:hypothetical protein